MDMQLSRRLCRAEPRDRRLLDAINGRFEPLQELGTGAVMVVHLAQDKKTGDLVAIKRLKADMLAKPDARYTMETEAKAISLASHPGIPKPVACSLNEPDPYIAEEFKDGLTFNRNNIREPSEVLRAGIDVCGILSALHSAGIVHRDVKPQNLILGLDKKSVSLIDYGFSIVPGMQDFAMRIDIAVGTPMFMAPEQTYPGVRVDHRVDIYSLAVILYSHLSGWYPYDTRNSGDMADEYIRAHRYQEAFLLHIRNPIFRPRLSLVIARALQKEPKRRFQHAEEFADALSDCLAPYDTA
ncbi:MAG: serine/threonine-protein kinase [Candidatus ainarchaeum sp.]|nr:serine/threonine-protein kinase [Candidatus ainarchaeum sp.]